LKSNADFINRKYSIGPQDYYCGFLSKSNAVGDVITVIQTTETDDSCACQKTLHRYIKKAKFTVLQGVDSSFLKNTFFLNQNM